MPALSVNPKNFLVWACKRILAGILVLLLAGQLPAQCSVSLLSSTDVDCFGASTGAASVTPLGASPFQYAWSSGGTGPFQSGLMAGTHTVTMTDNNNCMDTLTFFLQQPDSFALDPILTRPTCHGDNDGAIWLDIFGGNNYQAVTPDSLDIGPFSGVYSGGFTRGYHFKAPVSFRILSLRVPTDIGTGAQSIQVLRFAGAPGTATPFVSLLDTFNVAGAAPIQVDIPVQAGDEIGILGGRGNSSSLLGSYGDPGYFTSLAGFPVQLERIYYQGNIAAIPATTGTVDQQVGGILARIEMTYDIQHYTYQWGSMDTTRGRSNLSAGTYAVTVTDSLGCQLTENILLSQPDSIRIDSTHIVPIACADDTAGGAIRLYVSGGTPAQDTVTYRVDTTGTFSWVTGTFTPVTLSDDQLLSGLPIGFTFRFWDQNHSTFNISSNGFLSFSGSSDGCCAGQQLPSTIFPNELIAFAWEDLSPNLGGSIGYLQAGTAPNRRLVVEFDSVPHFGNTGLLVSTQIILYETSNIIEVHTRRMDTDGGAHTMGIENAAGTRAVVRPGRNSNGNWSAANDYVAFIPSGAYTYAWSNGGLGPSIAGLNTGNYTVTITDSLGCSLVESFTVGVQAVIMAGLTVSDISCYGAGDGSAQATVVSGNPPFQYLWSNGDSVANLNGLPAQTIYYDLVDSLGCTAQSDTLVIAEPDSLSLATSTSTARCEFDTDGQAIATVSGGVGGYTFQWNDPGQQMTDTAFALGAGTYTVIVRDSNSCADTATAVVAFQLTAPLVTFPDLDSLCLNLPPFQLTTGTPTGGVYSGAGVSNGQFSTAAAGPGVHLLVYAFTDGNGCTGTDTSYVNVKICAGLADAEQADWVVFPVPARDFLLWQGSVSTVGEALEFRIFDLAGKPQATLRHQVRRSGLQRVPLDLSRLPAGTYLLEVRNQEQVWMRKIQVH